MSAQSLPLLTPEEYLAIEREAPFKSEYYDGHMYAMSGGKFPHHLIASNLLIRLGTALKGRCLVVGSDMRLQVPSGKFYTYPDITVVCGKPQFASDDDLLLNPKVLIEVLSPSTEAHDRGFKFKQYTTIPSLQEYVLVAQPEPRVECFTRQADGRWLWAASTGLDAKLLLESVGCEIELSEIYADVEFPSAEAS